MSPKRATRRRRNFYGGVIDDAYLDRAKQVEGLDEELAALRDRLRKLLKDHPESLPPDVLKSMGLIVKAVGVRYRMSQKSRDALADSLAETIGRIGAEIFRTDDDDG
ncbi:MAG: hypothetical protein WEC75_03535 [Dehalococcoidia bacterium]